ncbi:MAG: hypothetical protein R3C59_09000 [Planctomycetaceae bacterium]
MRISTIRISAVAILASLAISQFAAADQKAETEAVKEHPLMPAIRYTEQCLERVEALPGYEATFIKREVVGNNTVSHRMKMKVRHEPFSTHSDFW